ncbi:MAG: hypothetical protein U1G05_13105 [Kiritimatiellia bacterium]
MEGDVLIHLVFARNGAEGRPREYGAGQISHAGTSPLWVATLRGLGRLSGRPLAAEDWLRLARVAGGGFLLLALVVLHRAARAGGFTPRAARALTLAFAAFPPVLYWCAADPMETSQAILVAVLLALSCLRAGRGGPWTLAPPLLAMAGYFVRPELLVLAGCAMPAILLATPAGERGGKIRTWSVVLALGLALVLAAAVLADRPLVPNAASARRLALMHFDTLALPLTGLRFSPDATIAFVLLSPLLFGAVRELRQPVAARRGAAAFALLGCLFAWAFFTFYYPTTWRFRYLLPATATLVVPGVAGICRGRTLRRLVAPYFLVLSLVLLIPLARQAHAPHARRTVTPDSLYWVPDAGDRTLLVQEVQGALYHPGLRYISTDGLIGLEAVAAWKRDLTVLQFVLEQRPGLIGIGSYYLRDPEGFADAVKEAAKEGRSTEISGIRLQYMGVMKGCGPVFRAGYPERLATP